MPPTPPECQLGSFREFSFAVWDTDRWQRGAPDGRTAAAERQKLSCAMPSDRARMKAAWASAKRDYGEYRTYRQVAPYSTAAYGYDVGHGPPSPADLRYLAIDPEVVCGESRFSFHPNSDGLYQIIPSTWAAYGGGEFSATASEATPLQQHIVAHRAWGHTAWYGHC